MADSVRHIFVDLDGVLADFVTAALHLHCRPEALSGWPLGEFECHRALQITPGQFWSRIDQEGARFWAELAPFPWMRELFDRLRSVAPVTIASSPSYDPGCLEGKVRWIQQHLGKKFRDFLIGPPKHLLARPDVALIDDSDRNIEKFVQHGGVGIVFPQVWNSHHALRDDRLGHVMQRLSAASAPPGALP